MDDNTLFRIASMTKAITSTCIYQLIDRDILSLDTNLKDFFPEISDKKVIQGFDDKGDVIQESPIFPTTVQLISFKPIKSLFEFC